MVALWLILLGAHLPTWLPVSNGDNYAIDVVGWHGIWSQTSMSVNTGSQLCDLGQVNVSKP